MKDYSPLQELSNKLNEMMKLQHANNINTAGKDYISKDLDWDLAIFVELGELVESTSYKWWKAQDIDLENIKTEIVDVWHFLMSKFMSSIHDPELIDQYITHFSTVYPNVFIPIYRSDEEFKMIFAKSEVDPKGLQHFTKQLIRRILIKEDPQVILLSFVELVASSQMNFNEFYKRYMIKNALNTLRQNRGYKEGTYSKEWDINGVKGEDNVVALSIINNSVEVDSFDEIYGTLLVEYDRMINS